MASKEYWWVSVGGNKCEPAVVTGDADRREIFTFGCPDPLTTENVELVEKMDEAPDTPKEAARKAAAWEQQREADRKRGIFHGYRSFD